MKKVVHIVGARPNFMKAAPVWKALNELTNFKQILIHTGQHYDNYMSDIFFQELRLPSPDYNLNIGSDTHARQTAAIMINLEETLMTINPDLVIVYGDVNSTAAAAIVCSKIDIPIAHVEAGLRSFDRRMPEEINRIITDQLADLLFTPSKDGDTNLIKEGINQDKIHFVGNVMIDTLMLLNSKANPPKEFQGIKDFVLVTIHRPSNVDNVDNLRAIIKNLIQVSKSYTVIFPIHPRTNKMMLDNGIDVSDSPDLNIITPLGYMEFLGLIKKAIVVLTDSGGIQEETTWLGIPCITVRENTERPITVSVGTNKLIGLEYDRIPHEVISAVRREQHQIPKYWDGKASNRIAVIIQDFLS